MATVLKRDYRHLLAILRPVHHSTKQTRLLDHQRPGCRRFTTEAQHTGGFSVSFGDPKLDAAFTAAQNGKAVTTKRRRQKQKQDGNGEKAAMGDGQAKLADNGVPIEIQPLIPQVMEIQRPGSIVRADRDSAKIEQTSGSQSSKSQTLEATATDNFTPPNSDSSGQLKHSAWDIRALQSEGFKIRGKISQPSTRTRTASRQSPSTRTTTIVPPAERVIAQRAPAEDPESQLDSVTAPDDQAAHQEPKKKLAPWQIKINKRLQMKDLRGYMDRSGDPDHSDKIQSRVYQISEEARTKLAKARTKDPEKLDLAKAILAEARERDPRHEATEGDLVKEAPAESPPKLKRDEEWQSQKDALQRKFGETGWNPRKKVSPDAMNGIRELHQSDPETYTTALLAQQFKISPEAVRRILKSKWQPSDDVLQDRRERWAKRHDRIWDLKHELGIRGARRKDRGVEPPEKFEEDYRRERLLEAAAANA